MKKNLLVALSVMFSVTSVSAQQKDMSATRMVQPAKYAAAKYVVGVDKEKAPMRSPETGVYYARPKGTYCQGSALDNLWATYYAAQMFVPAFKDMTFTNMCTAADQAVWSVNGTEISPDEFPENFTPTNDFLMSFANAAGYISYPPTISVGGKTYTFGESSEYFQQYGSAIRHCDTLLCMTAVDYTAGKMYTGLNGQDYGFGTYNFEFDEDGDEGPEPMLKLANDGVFQYYDAPASPLWFDRLRVWVLSNSGEPFKGQGRLLVEITDTANSDLGYVVPGKHVLATLDVNEYEKAGNFSDGTAYGMLTFSKKEMDILGTETNVPVVVDQPYCVRITGFQNEGVDVGFAVYSMGAVDGESMQPTRMICLDESGNQSPLFLAYRSLVAPIEFVGLMDAVTVLGNDSLAVLRISEDGTECQNEGADADTGMGGAVVYTACPWLTDAGVSQYQLIDAPEWVRSVNIMSDYRNERGYVGMEVVSFECDPLPVGEKGRFAEIYVQGRGVKSEYPIILLQGDVNVTATGIGNAVVAKPTVNTKTYNLRGMNVDNDAKGLVIKGGKKIINK